MWEVEVPEWGESASVEGFRLVQGESSQKPQSNKGKAHPQPASKKRKRKETESNAEVKVDTATVASPTPATNAATTPSEQSGSEEPRKKKRRRGKRGGKKTDNPVPPKAHDSEPTDRHDTSAQAKTKPSNTPRSTESQNQLDDAPKELPALRKKKEKKTKEVTRTQTTDLSSLQQKLKTRLKGSIFRWLNEKFYTVSGSEAQELFKEQPDMFMEYHRGFQSQVAQWPTAPVDVFISQLKKLPSTLRVADMGCGEAKIAQCALQTVHSFDLVPINKWITPCDIAHVPLENKSVDIVIFCLSLMGTNFMDYLVEAHRILVVGGTLKIAEVKSRFNNTEKFVKVLEKLGFDLVRQEDDNKMFILWDAKKTNRKSVRTEHFRLRACKYKKR